MSFHLLLVFTSSRRWILLSADVKSAFLKGEELAPGERELYLMAVNLKVLLVKANLPDCEKGFSG